MVGTQRDGERDGGRRRRRRARRAEGSRRWPTDEVSIGRSAGGRQPGRRRIASANRRRRIHGDSSCESRVRGWPLRRPVSTSTRGEHLRGFVGGQLRQTSRSGRLRLASGRRSATCELRAPGCLIASAVCTDLAMVRGAGGGTRTALRRRLGTVRMVARLALRGGGRGPRNRRSGVFALELVFGPFGSWHRWPVTRLSVGRRDAPRGVDSTEGPIRCEADQQPRARRWAKAWRSAEGGQPVRWRRRCSGPIGSGSAATSGAVSTSVRSSGPTGGASSAAEGVARVDHRRLVRLSARFVGVAPLRRVEGSSRLGG